MNQNVIQYLIEAITDSLQDSSLNLNILCQNTNDTLIHIIDVLLIENIDRQILILR